MAVCDWQSGKTLSESNRHMLENEICCDVTFLVGENRRRMSAHKYILVSRSSVFYAMFCGPFVEMDGKDIEIPDVTEKAFTYLLRYMYHEHDEEIEVTSDLTLSVLYAAIKYAVRGLEDRIISILEDNISSENVCTILDQAILYEVEKLELTCLEMIDSNAETILCGGGFKDLSKMGLIKVLSRDTLRIDEKGVFQAAMDWSKAECMRQGLVLDGNSRRQVLGDALHLVRFPLLDSKYLAQTVIRSNILSSEEISDLFQIINGNREECASDFSSKPRAPVIMTICQYSPDTCHAYPTEEFESSEMKFDSDFFCSRDIFLYGICVYGPDLVDLPYVSWNVRVNIGKDEKTLAETSCSFAVGTEAPLEGHMYPVMLSEPLPVPANLKLEIQLTSRYEFEKNPDISSLPRLSIYAGDNLMRTKEINGYEFTFSEMTEEEHNDYYFRVCRESEPCQIAGLLFSAF